MSATEKKQRQLAEIAAENEYFAARPGKDSDANRDLFEAGFQRGFSSAGINKDALLESAIQMHEALQTVWLVMGDLAVVRSDQRQASEIRQKLWSPEFDEALARMRLAMMAGAKAMDDKRPMPPSSQDKKIKRLTDALRQVIGDHNAPADCYSSGPFYGDARDDVCPSCEALRILEEHQKSKCACGKAKVLR